MQKFILCLKAFFYAILPLLAPVALLSVYNLISLNPDDKLNNFIMNSFILLSIALGPIILIFARNYKLYFLLNLIFFSLASVAIYFKTKYSLHLTYEIFEPIMTSSISEWLDYINLELIAYVLFLGLLPALLMVKACKNINIKHNSILIICLIGILIIFSDLLLSKMSASRVAFNSSPVNLIFYLYGYVSDRIYQDKIKVNDFKAETYKGPGDLKVILVIGESARADHFSLNGYKRETNPYLSKIPNLINYTKVSSLACITLVSVNYILKRKFNEDHVSLVKLMEGAGFETKWISNQGSGKSSLYELAKESGDTKFIHRVPGYFYDEQLLPLLSSDLSKGKNQFFVVHSYGSHHHYDMRYPEQFKKFTPTCKDTTNFNSLCTKQPNLNNSYDNSILYTDYFLSALINEIKDENSLLFYISDHGESLGENNIYLHGRGFDISPIEQTHIPMMVWASDKFIQSNESKINILKENREEPVTQKNIFHTIPDCLGLNSNIDKKYSLCRKITKE